ncbi:MAG: mercury(II) reductase [Gemmatimonadaceae bacterium]
MPRPLTLRIGGMTCLDCSKRITSALRRVEGVSGATVDYRVGAAKVELSKDVPPQVLISAVERAGYTAQVESDGSEDTSRDSDLVSASATLASTGQPPESSPFQAKSDPEHTNGSDFDLLIVGSGGAGVAAAIQAVGMGAKVAIVEAGTLGGTCVNVGCIPSKNLIEAAAHYHTSRTSFQGIDPCEPPLDWSKLIEQKNDLVAELRREKYADVIASYPGLALLHGKARLLGKGRVQVEGQEHSVRKVIVATGGSPAWPAIPGIDKIEALDSTSIMELKKLPPSLLVLGGSAVGLELGQMFARFGTKVTIVELLPRLLPNEDEAISDELRRCLEEDGLEIHTGVKTTRARREGDEIVLDVLEGSLAGTLRASSLLVATGRAANTRNLGLEEAGVDLTSKGFVKVDATMRTSNSDVYAAGDVTGGPGYVYVAAAGGRIAAENAMKSLGGVRSGNNDPTEFDLSVVPNLTFTSPQVASVGLTERAARELGRNPQVSVLTMDQVPRAIVSRDARGLVKIVADAASGKLLGVHAVATNAGEFMGEAALAIRFGLSARDIAGTLHPYLTWGESIKLAAQGFTMDISKLSCCA